MEALYMLIPIAIGVMIVVVIAFIYTVRSGQYDDLEGPAYRILMDDDDPRIPHQPKKLSEKSSEHSTATDKSV
ncbi:cbb3-type cytochrome oxidase assembly protein CcoS [uncultured Thiothrix sp.]|uniref:cbb3-type cytochrome oxidase assembly protein CcoS n=1 Tax=uncultured Thiothrix sp. TaxID=223185 RepID=UPI0026331863|nr:cbb3-type cytochrome oxidase assembly protein CcoS [uncultured Thiothrix sp.]HMT92967.1 cbb3-type cytochrome oxidase assembly protein CcoS [Thiolinea sp.]